eukprot:CAMPEP_0119132516 /NCGR_PEP_ID=MMETSP1310-20130426/11878_1 /TAXON_ID=464262 /ORGANISM="Genus nov. species nov., Strain RCC2339" /LENGTH=690 /DNA_ID=CAMNT_0007123153 /DNA_START=125 /DNA_END=2197 /DNA_ORIENTATION=+
MKSYPCPEGFQMPNDLKSVHLNFENEDREVMNLVPRSLTGKLKSRIKHGHGYTAYLGGPGGYGKSTILYQLVCELLNDKDICVFYIPELHNVLQEPDMEEGIIQLLDRLRKQALVQQEKSALTSRVRSLLLSLDAKCIESLERKGLIMTRFKKVLSCIRGNSNMVLIVDQWNAAFLEVKGIHQELAINFQGILNSTSGNIICAVSASFVCTNSRLALPDGTEQTKRVEVSKFSASDGEALIRYYQSRRGYRSVTESDIEVIMRLTSGIPRLIRFVEEFDLSNRSAWEPKLKEKATKYYTKCIEERIIKPNAGGEKDFAITLLMACLGKGESSPLDSGWGLFQMGADNRMVPVSEFVLCAARQRLHRKDSLLSLKELVPRECNGYLLELYVIYCLEYMKEQYKPLSFDGSNIFGSIMNVRKLDPSDIYAEDFKLHIGDAIVICGNFPVIDFVVYTGNRIAFIQVSMSAYSSHRKHYRHLFQFGLQGGPPRRPDPPGNQESIFEFFCRKAGKDGDGCKCSQAQPNRPNDRVRKNLLYVYIHGGIEQKPTEKDVCYIPRSQINEVFEVPLLIGEVLDCPLAQSLKKLELSDDGERSSPEREGIIDGGDRGKKDIGNYQLLSYYKENHYTKKPKYNFLKDKVIIPQDGKYRNRELIYISWHGGNKAKCHPVKRRKDDPDFIYIKNSAQIKWLTA